MKWVLIIGGAVVAVIAIVAIVGTMLPRDHVATGSAHVSAAPDAVWQAIVEQTRQSDVPTVIDVSEPPHRLVPIFRFVSRFVMGHTATIDTFLRTLGKRFA